jgi:hypothetical protein
MYHTVWTLRSRKLQQLELLGLDNKQQMAEPQLSGTVEEVPTPKPESRLRAYLHGMIAVKRV